MSTLVLHPIRSILSDSDGIVSRVGIIVGLGGISVEVGSTMGVTVSVNWVGVTDDSNSVAVRVGGRIFGVAVWMDGVCEGMGVSGVLYDIVWTVQPPQPDSAASKNR
jgi:hypothetical protein